MIVKLTDLYSCRDKEVNKDRLDLGLSRLKIVSSQKHLFLLGQLHHSRNKRILRRTVDVCALGRREETV